jgi:uncharacterized membrane protein YheB (UPF0754 family)
MERINFKQQVYEEKRAVETRLDALKAELNQAQTDFESIQAEYDSALMSGDEKKTDSILNRLQKQILKRDSLTRVIDDIEKRLLPEFPEKLREARDAARQKATEEIKPVHAAAKAEIESLVSQIDTVISEFFKEINTIKSAWGASGVEHLEKFSLKLPPMVKNHLSFENVLLQEVYRQSAAYQPNIGVQSGMQAVKTTTV